MPQPGGGTVVQHLQLHSKQGVLGRGPQGPPGVLGRGQPREREALKMLGLKAWASMEVVRGG